MFCIVGMLRPANAESDFSIALYGGSQNFWSSSVISLPTSLINGLISCAIDDDDESIPSLHYQYDFFKIKNNGEEVDSYTGKYFGFKAKDMFSNIHYGVKFGWQPKLSPFGIYVSCAYRFRRFETKMNPMLDTNDKFKIHRVSPGIGIRITPFINMLEDYEWSPIVEIGTSYGYVVGCKAPYDNNKDQFNNILTSSFAIGARFETFSVTGGVEIDHGSLFNKDFTPDGVNFPYKDVKTSLITVFVTVARDF